MASKIFSIILLACLCSSLSFAELFDSRTFKRKQPQPSSATDPKTLTRPRANEFPDNVFAPVLGRPNTVLYNCSKADLEIYRDCKALETRLKDPKFCPGINQGLKFKFVDDATPEDIDAILAGMPRKTPVFLDGHGTMAGADLSQPDGPANPDRHYFILPKDKGDANEKGEFAPGKSGEVGMTQTQRYLRVIARRGGIPYVNTCHAFGAFSDCAECGGAACAKEETAFSYREVGEKSTAEILDVLCHPEKFAALMDSDGVIRETKLDQHFCKLWGGEPVKIERFVVDASKGWEGALYDEANSKTVKTVGSVAEVEQALRLARAENPRLRVTQVDHGKAYRLKFRDPVTGSVDYYPLGSYQAAAGAEKMVSSIAADWKKNCSSVISRGTAPRKGVDCEIEPAGHLYTVEVRRDTNACIASFDHLQSPKFRGYELHNPYENLPAVRTKGLGELALDVPEPRVVQPNHE